jgi:3-deoxy-D-manno-octulosonic-acid transferase
MELGAPPENVAALGSVKFDVLLPADHESRVMRLQESWNLQSRKVWCAGSTHEGEEAVVLDAHRAVLDRFPEALLILVPRHPSRVDDVVRLLEERNFVHARQSLDDPVDAHVKVVLADTMGELLYLYGLSRVAYLGGSLVSVGGHNPIEAAVCGQPLVMGPETFNFPEVIAAFTDAGCLSLVRNDSELARVVTGYLADAELTSLHGQAARRVVLENRGAAQRLVNLLRAQILAVS